MLTYMIKSFYVLLGGAVLLASSLAPAGGADGSPSTDTRSNPAQLSERSDALRIGPGRASFTFTREGGWLGFGRIDEAPVIPSGGIVVLAADRDGSPITVVDTRIPGLVAVASPQHEGRAQEGAPGGRRAPSPRPDDDGDGYIDEDRLDGVDNDGDGKIDEDFAAVGDAMQVTTFRTAAVQVQNGPSPQATQIELHQESYGWTVSHIDGVIVTRVSIRNLGDTELENLRVGAAFELAEGMGIESRAIGREPGPFEDIPVSRATVLRGDNVAAAVIFFSPRSRDEEAPSWVTGVTRDGADLAKIVRAASDAAVFESGEVDAEDPIALHVPKPETVYAISPDLGTLAPGATVEAVFAMVLAGDPERISRAMDDAYRTVIGDGTQRFIPPPLSITRRVLWGTYDLRVPDDPGAGVTVTLADPGAEGIMPMQIDHIEGIDMRRAIRTALPDGNARIEVSGDNAQAFGTDGRLVLRGRTRDGEWFDAVLQPATTAGSGQLLPAERYFGEPGKLDEALLSGSPNPFRDATTVHYEVPSQMTDEFGNMYGFAGQIEATVKVYNVTGRLVSTLVDNSLSPGRYQTQWTARDETGSSVASGVYYVKLQLGKKYITKRLIQLK